MADSLFLFVVRFFAGEYCTISIFFSIIETAALDSAPLVLTAASAYDGSSSCRTKNTFQHYSCQQIHLSSKASRYLYLFHFLGLLSSLYLLTSLKTHTEFHNTTPAVIIAILAATFLDAMCNYVVT